MVSGQWRKQRERTAGAEGLADVFLFLFFFFFYIFFVSHREDFLAKDSHEEMIISWQFSSGPLLRERT